MLKLQIIQSDEEVHSLSQDMARLMSTEDAKDTIVNCACGENEQPLTCHSWIIRCRSAKLACRLLDHQDQKNKVRFIILEH